MKPYRYINPALAAEQLRQREEPEQEGAKAATTREAPLQLAHRTAGPASMVNSQASLAKDNRASNQASLAKDNQASKVLQQEEQIKSRRLT